mmetsp:Transcript_7619/g.8745  ORF Transcript_7619/g.8745 Transcript_7619/m.8745 type:complete len:90 (+) Transcript_7619:193-462(+)
MLFLTTVSISNMFCNILTERGYLYLAFAISEDKKLKMLPVLHFNFKLLFVERLYLPFLVCKFAYNIKHDFALLKKSFSYDMKDYFELDF